MTKAFGLFLAAALALAGFPVGAQDLPNSLKGSVPAGIEGVANAVLQDASDKTISMVPVVDGRFAFRNVAPGEYSVGLYSASGQRVARSCPVTLATGAAREASFDCPVPAAAAPTATTSTAVARGGIGTAGWIVIGAAAVGITTAVVIATNKDEGVASATR
jgi:hypothetical protein